jgi:hypothetical protein
MDSRETWERRVCAEDYAARDGKAMHTARWAYTVMIALGVVMMTVGLVAAGCSMVR